MAKKSNTLKMSRMISAKELHELWPGLKLRELVKHIDERIASETDTSIKSDFPEPFFLLGTSYITKDGGKADKLVYLCQKCSDAEKNCAEVWKPYKVKLVVGKKRYYLKRVVFKLSDIELYQAQHKDISYTQSQLNEVISAHLKSKNEKRRPPIKQKDAAKLCGSVLQQFAIGKITYRPDAYPGRYDLASLVVWARTYQSRKDFIRIALAKGKPLPMDPAMLDSRLWGNYDDDDNEFTEED